jgi:predicted nucleic acid-binding protein
MEHIFLDTNIIIRFLTRDELEKADAAEALFERIKRNELTVTAPDTVIAECVHVLSSRRLYNKSREEIRLALSPLLALEGFKVSNRRMLLRALDLYATYPIDFSDAFLKAAMEAENATIIYSYDTDFDRFPEIIRREPEPAEKRAA